MQFNVIQKEPKNKIQAVRERAGEIVGYFEYMVGFNEYRFKPAFEKTFTLKELSELCDKANELNK